MSLDPNNENARWSIWQLMDSGTHAQIVKVLEVDPDIIKVIKNFTATPSPQTRDKAVDLIVRYTGNCIGQAGVQEARGTAPANQKLMPASNAESIYKVLPPGSEERIYTVIDADSHTREALHNGNLDATVSLISRMTGRCVGQSLFSGVTSVVTAVGRLLTLVGHLT